LYCNTHIHHLLRFTVDRREEALKLAKKLKYPVIVKAAAGGGGRGGGFF